MPRSAWADRYVVHQRRLFVRIWTTHVKAQLRALNEHAAPRHYLLTDIPAVGPMRTAALLASEWMHTPRRLARAIDPEDESEANRAAVRSVLFLATAEMSGLHPEIVLQWGRLADGLSVDVAARLRTAPLARWDDVVRRAREFGLDDDDGDIWRDFLATARANGLAVHERPETPTSGGGTDSGFTRPAVEWLPTRSAANWFGPSAAMASRPTQEKRHAVVDAFFHDQYRDLTPRRRSPVHLLASFPDSDLVDQPDPYDRTAPYERACRRQNLAWHQHFVDRLDGYAEACLARAALEAHRRDVTADQSPAVSAVVPDSPAVLAVLIQHLGALGRTAEESAAACGQAADAVRVVKSSDRGMSAAAIVVLEWLATDRDPSGRIAVNDALAAVPMVDHYALLRLCHDALPPVRREHREAGI